MHSEVNLSGRHSTRRGINQMSDSASEFERLLGHAALELWPGLPRDVQELLFETAVPIDLAIRTNLAVFLHERHPRTAHPPKPTRLAYWSGQRRRNL
jgi:hypothetical protein